MFLWLKTLYRKRAVTWPFIFYTIIWTLSMKKKKLLWICLVFLLIIGGIEILTTCRLEINQFKHLLVNF